MNNDVTARLPLRVTELSCIITLQVLGLLTNEGGVLAPTDKLERLASACTLRSAGATLLPGERALLVECAPVLRDL